MGSAKPEGDPPADGPAASGRNGRPTRAGAAVPRRRAPLRFPHGTSMNNALRDARTRRRMLEAVQGAVADGGRGEVLLVEVLLGRDPNALTCTPQQLPGILRWMRGCALDAGDAEGARQCTELLARSEDQYPA